MAAASDATAGWALVGLQRTGVHPAVMTVGRGVVGLQTAVVWKHQRDARARCSVAGEHRGDAWVQLRNMRVQHCHAGVPAGVAWVPPVSAGVQRGGVGLHRPGVQVHCACV